MKLRDFMTQGVHTVRPDDTLDAAAKKMWEHDCGVLPVVNEHGQPVAMITDRDVCMAAYTQGKSLSKIRVDTAMSNGVVACHRDDSPFAAERSMRERQIRRLPVVDDVGRLVGIVSLNDFVLETVANGDGTHGDLNLDEMAATFAAICRHTNRSLSAARPE